MASIYDLRLDRSRCNQVEKIVQQINSLVIAEDRPASAYRQIREALLDATVHLHRAVATYRVLIAGQEGLAETGEADES